MLDITYLEPFPPFPLVPTALEVWPLLRREISSRLLLRMMRQWCPFQRYPDPPLSVTCDWRVGNPWVFMAVVEYTVSTNVGLAMAFSLSEALAFLCVRQVQFVSNHCSHEPVIARSHSWSTMSRRSTEVPPFSFRDLPYAPKASESSTISRAWIQQRPREVLIASKGLHLGDRTRFRAVRRRNHR